ncbi:MAG: stealth family protein [Microbacteriaceae bacterium]
MVEDLLFIRSALVQAGIEFRLVRGNDERPVIAIDAAHRGRAARALAIACADEPFYAETVGGRSRPPLLLGDGQLSARSKANIFRLYRPRREPTGGLRYGSSTGIELQLWVEADNEIIVPVENSLTRRVLNRSELVEATVELYGQRWPTLRGMFEPHASDVTFDIDLVFSWVDGNDPEYQRARAKRSENYIVGAGDDSDARFRQIDELKYAMRSVHLFAPWVRRIFIVTDSPRPHWLAEHPAVTIVRSAQFFSHPEVLPTHNSQAVESQLHHIPGLSEHFLYSNDDMFFGRSVQPEMFFSPGGITRFIEGPTRIGLGESDLVRSGFENAARVNRRLLREKFGVLITRHLEHAPTPLRVQVLRRLEQTFPAEFAQTEAARFRSSTDISVTNSLYHYYALITGSAVQQRDARVRYIDTTSVSGLNSLAGLLRRRNADFFCLNDGSFSEVSAAERKGRVVSFLDRYFAIPAPWERD